MNRSAKKYLLLFSVALLIFYLAHRRHLDRNFAGSGSSLCPNVTNQMSRKTTIFGSNGDLFEYDRSSSIIFVGGVAKSGLGLAVDIIQNFPGVHCHGETIILPKVLQMRQQWFKNQKESTRLAEAGMSSSVLESAFSSLALEVLARIEKPSRRLCNKDPAIFKYAIYLKQLFPKSKFLLMIRDPRATVDSIVTNKMVLPGYDIGSYRTSLFQWNNDTSTFISTCDQQLGPASCMKVFYEELVHDPPKWIPQIIKFLGLPDNHEIDYQIVKQKPGQMSAWLGHIPKEVLQDLDSIVPVMRKLHYEP